MRTGSCRRAIITAGVILSAVAIERDALMAQARVYRSSVELVPLTVTVTDRTGRYVPNLTAADFAVFEEGQPQVVSHFAAGDVPTDVGFLLDTSSSMKPNLALAQKAACGLVRRLRAGDRAAVAGIASNVLLHQSMTADLGHVDAALRSTRTSGDTALYDALYVTLRSYQQERSASSEVRRQVIVVLSDGLDTASHVSFEDVLDLVRRVEATIYVVSLGDDPLLATVHANRKLLESAYAISTLARESGGRLFTPRTARELPGIYDAIGQELSSQYVIGYVPSGQAAAAGFRHVSVGVLEPHAGRARTRTGYYADRVRAGAAALLPSGWPGR